MNYNQTNSLSVAGQPYLYDVDIVQFSSQTIQPQSFSFTKSHRLLTIASEEFPRRLFIQEFSIGERRIRAKAGYGRFSVRFNTKTLEFELRRRSWGLYMTSKTLAELKEELREELGFLWEQYAIEKDEVLSKGALELKQELLDHFEESI